MNPMTLVITQVTRQMFTPSLGHRMLKDWLPVMPQGYSGCGRERKGLRDATLVDEDLQAAHRDAFPDGTPEKAIQHQVTIFGLSWSPDGGILASATRCGTIRFWNPATGKPGPLAEVGTSLGVSALDWSPEGRLLAWGTGTGRIVIADPEAGKRSHLPLGHPGAVWSLLWSPAGDLLASGGEDGMVRVWAATDHLNRALDMAPLAEGHSGSTYTIAWTMDGSKMVSSGSDLTARFWDATSGNQLTVLGELPSPTLAMTTTPSGVLLASMVGSRQTVRLWEGPDKGPLDLTEITGPVFSLALSPDSQTVASGDSSETIWLRNIETGEPAGVLLPPSLKGSEPDNGSFLPVRSLSWSPDRDGRFLASVMDRATVIWELQSRTPHRILEPKTSAIHREAGSSDFGLENGTGLAVDIDRHALAWSPDGSQLAWRGERGSICVWDSGTDETRRLEGHVGAVYAVGWSASGRLLSSAGNDGTVRLWDVRRLSCLAINRCLGPVLAVRFAENGGSLQAADDGSATDGRPLPYLFSIENLMADR